MNVKSLIKAVLPKNVQGLIDYHLFYDKYLHGCGGPLNGQDMRLGIYKSVLEKLSFDCIVETGTYRGTSTEFFNQSSGLPVYSVEVHPRFYTYSKNRLKDEKDIHLHLSDSRSFLKDVVMKKVPKDASVFFYLDAHWYNDLPLLEEMRIIKHWEKALVLVDDFKVPGDDGYSYDDYGPDKQLTLDYLSPLDKEMPLRKFFPANSKDERADTGVTIGCILMTGYEPFAEALTQVPNLWEHL